MGLENAHVVPGVLGTSTSAHRPPVTFPLTVVTLTPGFRTLLLKSSIEYELSAPSREAALL